MTQPDSVSRRDVWAARMRRYQQCQSTVARFCRDEGVSVPSFYNWKRKLAEASESKQPKFGTSHASPSDYACPFSFSFLSLFSFFLP